MIEHLAYPWACADSNQDINHKIKAAVHQDRVVDGRSRQQMLKASIYIDSHISSLRNAILDELWVSSRLKAGRLS